MICINFIKQWQRVIDWQYVGSKTAVYVILGILLVAFLFFIINTLRCYFNKRRFVEEDENEMVAI